MITTRGIYLNISGFFRFAMSKLETALPWLSFSGSLITLLLGIADVIYRLTLIQFQPTSCNFYYCNIGWRGVFSFAPDIFFDTFQPILLGLIGLVYSLPEGLRPASPASLSPPTSVMGGIFHIIMAFFGNMGYLSVIGIVAATINMALGCAFILIRTVFKKRLINAPRKAVVIDPMQTEPTIV
jgi:hypothetical protein